MIRKNISILAFLIYKVSMEEARWEALCPGTLALLLTIGGKCSCLRAKPAHFSGHLPLPVPGSTSSSILRVQQLHLAQALWKTDQFCNSTFLSLL